MQTGAYQARLGHPGILYPPQLAQDGYLHFGSTPHTAAAATGGGLFYAREHTELQCHSGKARQSCEETPGTLHARCLLCFHKLARNCVLPDVICVPDQAASRVNPLPCLPCSQPRPWGVL